ncbi:tRNA (adenosine(37)-N6)-threonylcarbamoyltransferase complex ATPase subunit type 1 TsaE [Leptolyngbya sp. FACHB-36]|uniref:tRNA (adenosine(37)-N6)-threonylcarbamoyltransferase complex ATPase subunit type 1 TsaE n=1 Tax=Leptolyngbya sp. FACHB-36 TaxID=2692808 RepID=UPI001680CE43|nr:tRNA (adenosine(37)-N6)-threonylcarbamoyltransferase complex ATPase subunit type 1 TsaE [Leptolyngbya sp. FACHB-36]MBD2020421.1 tRNA (adenosine(37)-N6)-threonylcarbamoyltransferase complex ATPase subunit type 1 TsaE [Leptolyngbya sp. FACHB-36]
MGSEEHRENLDVNITDSELVLQLSDAAATRRLGVALGRSLPAGSVLLLAGELGSGKTTLVQGIGEGLGMQESIDSPTFTLIQEYQGGRLPLYHFDLYRLTPVEAATLYPESYWEGLEVEPGIVAIEWAERLPYKPESYLLIGLTYDQGTGRHAALRTIGSMHVKLTL